MKSRPAPGIFRDAVQGAAAKLESFSSESLQRRNAPEKCPALRVAAHSGAHFVARLADGMTIGYAARLVSIRSAQQRRPVSFC
jgi:hypothetical protein